MPAVIVTRNGWKVQEDTPDRDGITAAIRKLAHLHPSLLRDRVPTAVYDPGTGDPEPIDLDKLGFLPPLDAMP